MTETVIVVIVGIVALAIGFFIGKALSAKDNQGKLQEAEQQAKKILGDATTTAENLKKEKLLEAKEKFVQYAFTSV